MPRIGPTELVIILFIVLIIFGAGRLPEIGGAIGKGIRAFKRGQSGEEDAQPEPEPEPELKTSKQPAKGKEKSRIHY